jgi:hypothetical protein
LKNLFFSVKAVFEYKTWSKNLDHVVARGVRPRCLTANRKVPSRVSSREIRARGSGRRVGFSSSSFGFQSSFHCYSVIIYQLPPRCGIALSRQHIVPASVFMLRVPSPLRHFSCYRVRKLFSSGNMVTYRMLIIPQRGRIGISLY